MNKLISKKVLIIIILLCLPAFSSLIRPGYFPMHDDIQGMRLLELSKCFLDGQIPCRWVPDMGYGYGYPQFSYYAPLAYYTVLPLVLLGGSVLESVKVMFVISVIGSAIGMYLLGARYWGKRGGILSALFYVYAPYRAVNMYVRGAVGEFWGMMFLPFIFYFALKLLDGKKKYIFPLSLSVAGLLLSHNITAVMILPFFIVFILISKRVSTKKILNLGISGVWGLGLAAFFVIPAFFEKEYVHVETILLGYFNYLAHFVSVKQIFLSTFWGYGSSTLGTLDGFSLTVGFLHWVIPVFALVVLVYLKKKEKIKSLMLFLALGLISLFFAHNKSVFIWDNISILSYVQFPWRFLAIGTFFFSLAAGAIVSALPKAESQKNLLIVSFFAMLILFYGSFFRPKQWLNINDSDKFSGESWRQQQTISIFDYLPKSADYPPAAEAPEQPQIIEGSGKIVSGEKGTNWQRWEVEMYEDSKLQLSIFDFPNWIVEIDNVDSSIDSENELGLITVNVKEGKHTVYTKLHDTPLRSIANIVTVLSMVGIAIYYRKRK